MSEWRWTTLGVQQVADRLGEFGYPCKGDPFTAAHLAMVQARPGCSTLSYMKLFHMGSITDNWTGRWLTDRAGKRCRVLAPTEFQGELFWKVQWESQKSWQGTSISPRCLKGGWFSISPDILFHVLANFTSSEKVLVRAFPSLESDEDVFAVRMSSTDSLADFEKKAAHSLGRTARLVHTDCRELDDSERSRQWATYIN